MNKEELLKKISYYFEKALPVHVVKPNGQFANGHIKEISEDFFLLKDFVVGDMPIFHSEIIDIIPFREREEK